MNKNYLINDLSYLATYYQVPLNLDFVTLDNSGVSYVRKGSKVVFYLNNSRSIAFKLEPIVDIHYVLDDVFEKTLIYQPRFLKNERFPKKNWEQNDGRLLEISPIELNVMAALGYDEKRIEYPNDKIVITEELTINPSELVGIPPVFLKSTFDYFFRFLNKLNNDLNH